MKTLLTAAFLLFALTLHAQWVERNNGLYGGGIFAMATSGANVFTGTNEGLFLSANNGTSWTAANTGLTSVGIRSLAISGSNIFVGTGGGVFLSTNNGTTWSPASTGLTDSYIGALAISGSNLFAGTNNGLFLSTDHGASWAQLNTGPINPVVSLAVSGSNIFAGILGQGILLSTDNGSSWSSANAGLTNTDVNTLAISGSNIFAGTDGGLFLSVDNGISWSESDSGGGWNVYSFAIGGSNIFAGTGGGVFSSNDNGANWQPANSGLEGNSVFALALSSGNVLAGTQTAGVFRSTDNGANWSAANTGITNTYIQTLPVIGSGIFAGTDGTGLFRSTDDGANWVAVNTGLPARITSMAAISSNLFVGALGGAFLSTDNGANWTVINTGLPNSYVAALAKSGSNIFAAVPGHGVFLSTNNGTNWTSISVGLPTSSYVTSLAVNGSTIFAGTNGAGIFISTDNGANWTAASAGLTDISSNVVNSFVFSGSNLFAGLYHGGVFLSTDNGASWTQVGLAIYNVYSLAISGTNIFAATGNGMFLSADNGTSWNPINSNLGNKGILRVSVDGSNIYAGTAGHGVWSRPLSDFVPSPFITTWQTDNPGTSASDQITLPVSGGPYDLYWEEVGNPTNNSTLSGLNDTQTITFPAPGTYKVQLSGSFASMIFNNGGDMSKLLTVEQWGSNTWQNVAGMFYGCANLDINATDAPDLSGVTSTAYMFAYASLKYGTFTRITDLTNWNVSSITDMNHMFWYAYGLAANISSWDVSHVTNMASAFEGYFQDISYGFNQNNYISSWNVSQVTNMSSMFRGNYYFNLDISAWNTANVIDMSSMFQGTNFNQDISTWNTANVINMSSMFQNTSFNQDIGAWNTAKVINMNSMFASANFNQPLNNWNVSVVADMGGMFSYASNFNQPLNNWSVSAVTNMRTMFQYANSFNQPVNNWDVNAVTDMSLMFNNASSFNQPLDNWNVSAVTNMNGMFTNAQSFNQPLDTWNVSSVLYMGYMFYNANSFNQPLGTWNVSAVTDMSSMFNDASSFNQQLNTWNVHLVSNMSSMFANSGLSDSNYDNILIGWAALPALKSNVILDAPSNHYCTGQAARALIIAAHGWTINDAGLNSSCSGAPTISSFSPTSAGAGTTVIITGTNFTGTTTISFGGTTASSFNVTSSTSIDAVVGSGASGTISVTTSSGTATSPGFTLIPAPTISSFSPTSADNGATVTITGANFSGATSVNFGGTSASSFNVTSATSIDAVVGTGTTGNVSITTPGGTATTTGSFCFAPSAPTSPANSSSCGAGSVTLSVSGGTNGQYVWYTTATGGTAIAGETNGAYTTPSLSLTTTYYSAISNGTCESARTSVTATVNSLPAAPTSPLNGSSCGAGNVTLSVSGGTNGQYVWYTAPTGGAAITGEVNSSYTIPTLSSTTTYYSAINNGTCESTRTAVTATINSLPLAPTSPIDGSSCGAGSVNLSVSGGTNGQYVWYTAPTGGTAISGEVNSSYTTPSLSSTTSYYSAINNGTCESTRTLVTATITSLPAAPTSPINGASCNAGSVTLSVSGGTNGQYVWYTSPTVGVAVLGEVNDSFTTPSLSSTTSYYVAINNGACESARTKVDANINTPPSQPTISANGATIFCQGGTVTLSSPGFLSYLWSDGSTLYPRVVSTSVILSLQVTDANGCQSVPSNPFTIMVNPLPATPVISSIQPVVNGAVLLCTEGNETTTLSVASGFASYQWSSGQNGSSFTTSLSGSYSVTVTDANGCVSLVSTPVSVNSTSCISITSETLTTQIEGTVSVSLLSLIATLKTLDVSSIKVVKQPTSGAVASVDANGELTVDYKGVQFSGTDSVTIIVCDVNGNCKTQELPIIVIGDIKVYNAVSPNGDGKNEFFNLEYIEVIASKQQNQVNIYNRWGDEVFSVNDYNNKDRVFSGYSNTGNKLPVGTYFYKISFNGEKPRTGYLELKY